MISRFISVVALMAAAAGAQSTERLTFDEQSVKPASPNGWSGGIRAMRNLEGWQATNVTVKLMMSFMYNVPNGRITGGPRWIDTERFDVHARTFRQSSVDELRIMFQNLIADEFKLRFHKEPREEPVYALMVDESGVKMQVNESTEVVHGPIRSHRLGEMIGTRVSMEYLATELSQIVRGDGRPVIDKTGLKGNYDFKMEFAPELPPGFDQMTLAPGTMEHPRLFQALREQLGLKLVPQQGPVDYFVIDSAMKPAAK
ncbi:MAG TPA: TIGR03435 family protein [Bryobacteraceae bacterium]